MSQRGAVAVAFGHERDGITHRRLWPYVGIALTATGLGLVLRAWRRRSQAQVPLAIERSQESIDADEEKRGSGPSV
jgi:hypothetical protein